MSYLRLIGKKRLTTLLITSYAKYATPATCPKLGKECGLKSQCGAGENCYGDLDDVPDKKSYCCNVVCPITKLITYHSENRGVGSHKENDKLDSKLFYKIEGMSCPFAFSYTTRHLGGHLPIGLSESGTGSVKECTTNADCGKGSYCGESVNPSFAHPEDSKERKLRTRDQSNNQKARMFCYKDPTVGDQFMITFRPSEVGLDLCKLDSDCKTQNSFCLALSQPVYLGSVTFNGVCVHAVYTTSNNQEKSIALPIKDGSQCKMDDDCNGLKDDIYSTKCETFDRPALPDDASSNKLKLCIFTPRNCKYGTARIPKLQCSTSADCNQGNGPWTSWCDDQGFCCGDTTGTLPFLCPDRVTLAIGEPECKDKCTNGGVCINGHCCPGLKYQEKKPILSEKPYKSNMPCDPTKPAPAHTRFTYCSADGFLVVIGRRDAFGKPYKRGVVKQCSVNADCKGTGFSLCVRESSKSSGCFPDPYEKKPEEEEEKETSSSPLPPLPAIIVPACVLGGVGIATYLVCRKKASTAYYARIDVVCNEILKTEKTHHRNAGLPPLTVRNSIAVVTTGTRTYAARYNIELYKVECYAAHAAEFIIYFKALLNQRIDHAHLEKIPTKGQYIPRSCKITKRDIKNGNKERVDVKLDAIYRDTEVDVLLGTENLDDLQFDSSTESVESHSVNSLAVERTQSDHSIHDARRNVGGRDFEWWKNVDNRCKSKKLRKRKTLINNLLNAVAYGIEDGTLPSMDEAYEAAEEYLDLIALLGEEVDEGEESTNIPVIVENIDNNRWFAEDSRLYKAFTATAEAYKWAKGKQPDELLDEYFAQRSNAGAENGRTRIINSMERSMPIYKKNSRGMTHEEEIRILKDLLTKQNSVTESEEIHYQIVRACFGRLKTKSRKYSSLLETLKEVENALKVHPKNVWLLDKKRIVVAFLLSIEHTESRFKQLNETLAELISVGATSQYHYERALLGYMDIDKGRCERYTRLHWTYKPDTTQITEDLIAATKLQPNSTRSWLLLGKLELKYGNKNTAITYLESAVRATTTTEDAFQAEAKVLLRENAQFQV